MQKKEGRNEKTSKKRDIFAAVETFGKHIVALLQENDCVVLPSFGAFIAHTEQAYYVDGEHSFFPPTRSIGFNKQLTSDDGLFTSYLMQKGGIGFAEAKGVVATYIDRLRDALGIDGAVKLPGLGRLRQDLAGNIAFEPAPIGISAPSLFGLDALTICDLNALEQAAQGRSAESSRPVKLITKTERTIDIHVGRRTLRRIASVAAAILLLIVFALPVSDGKYTDVASLGITALSAPSVEEVTEPIEAIEPLEPIESVETTGAAEIIENAAEPTETAMMAEALQPEATAVQPEPTAVEVVPAKPANSRVYHVIVASLPSMKGADAVVQKYIDLGFPEATSVTGDDRVRISIASFTDKKEGEDYIQTLRQSETLKHLWLLSMKAK